MFDYFLAISEMMTYDSCEMMTYDSCEMMTYDSCLYRMLQELSFDINFYETNLGNVTGASFIKVNINK